MILSSSVLQMELQATAKAEDFHLLLSGGRSERVPLHAEGSAAISPASVPAGRAASSRESRQPSRWWEEWRAQGVLQGWRSYLLVRLFGISRPPHAGCLPLDGVCWDSWEKSPNKRLLPLQARKARGERLLPRGDLAAPSLRLIPAGRNSCNCCLFFRRRQGSSQAESCV